MDNQFDDAVDELKKLEKKVFDSWSYIGIYKRYNLLGEDELSEKLLKSALKKNPNSLELNAIYSQFLINHNRYEQALSHADILRGTKYGSIYSEATIKHILSENPSTKDFYKDKKYYNIYLDAYESSKNPLWLRNCAIFNMREGLYESASALAPSYFENADDAYFWALVLYDSGNYYGAVECLEVSKHLLKDYPNPSGVRQFKTTEVQQIALQSDAYIALNNLEKADLQRQLVISKMDNLENILEIDEDLLPLIVVNSAIYAQSINEMDRCADLLFDCVNRWPYYVPALILYSDFAYNSNLQRQEDFEVKMLRETGLGSLEMENYDNRRIIPLSDALYRIEEALKVKKDPNLAIVKLDLKYKLNKNILEKEKTADLWYLLEKNYSEEVKFESLLVQYTISHLLKTKNVEDAFNLFTKHVKDTYKIAESETFWEEINANLSFMDVGMVEIAAWFAAYFGIYDEAFRFYEYVVYESAGILQDGFISPLVSTISCLNLAEMYYSVGKEEKALDLYGKAAGREVDSQLRSECFYRIATIYSHMNDKKNALRSIDYALSINPSNAGASLLKSKLIQEE